MGDGVFDFSGQACGVAGDQAFGGEATQGFDGCFILANDFGGVGIDQLIEAEIDALGQSETVGDRRLIAAKQTGHFGRGFEVAFRIGGQFVAGGLDGHMFADTGDDIGQGFAIGGVVERVCSSDGGDVERGGEGVDFLQALTILSVEIAAQGEGVLSL